MPIARPSGHSGITSQMPSRSTVSGSGQPGKLRGWGCSWRQSQGCSGIKQNMPLSDCASQHLAPAAGEQINIIVSTELQFLCVWKSMFHQPVLQSCALPELVHQLCHFFFLHVSTLLRCRVSGFNFISCVKLHMPEVFVPFFSWRKENNNSILNLGVLRKFLWLKTCEQRCPGRAPQAPEYPASSAKGWYSTS